jgi:hypothetical protein
MIGTLFFRRIRWIFKVIFSTLIHLPPLRIHCVGGCWDRTQDCCDFSFDSQKLSSVLVRSHPILLDLIIETSKGHAKHILGATVWLATTGTS